MFIKGSLSCLFRRQFYGSLVFMRCSSNIIFTRPTVILRKTPLGSILPPLSYGPIQLGLVQSRFYAKKAKETKKKADKSKIHLTNEEINEIVDYNKMKSQMEQTLEYLKKEYHEQLSLTLSVGTLENVIIKTSDGNFYLNQLGQIVQKTAQLLLVNMESSPQYISQVKLALSQISLNPQLDGTTIFVPIPKMSRENRELLAKNAKMFCEKTKEKLRHIQNIYVKDLKKVKDNHSADLIFAANEMLLNTTKDFIEEAENLMIHKQEELLGK